jgi:ribosomal-protein-alanine N-acetyltransferase
MTPEALAALHRRCFDDSPPPWSAGDFGLLLTHPGARLATGPGGFALAQSAGPEAELLTIAVDPDQRRQGHARALLEDLATRLAAEGIEEIFLEVAETNTAARGLYLAAGYSERGRRRGYYRRAGGAPIDAVIMGLALS